MYSWFVIGRTKDLTLVLSSSLKNTQRLTMNNCIGLDISKSTINVHIPNGSLDLEIENSKKAISALFSKLKKIYKKEPVKKMKRSSFLVRSDFVIITIATIR